MDDVATTIFDGQDPLFEQQSKENGFTSWSARSFAEHLGYKDYDSFSKSALNRAHQVCLSLDIEVAEHFKQVIEGCKVVDMRLSRFACYLCAMNGDPKKPLVAKAQAYFARFAEACRRYIEEGEAIDRVLVRDDISDKEKSLNSTAKQAGVVNYGFFQSSGYRGLYNMPLSRLRTIKGVPAGRSPLDFMGKDELAANLFRVTQTEAKIRNDGIRGQVPLERVAFEVGRKVRNTMEEISGQRPEALPPAEDIAKVRTGLRHTGKGLQDVDKKRKKLPPGASGGEKQDRGGA